MITVYFYYVTKSGVWKTGEKEFASKEKAIRFIWKIMRSDKMSFDSISADLDDLYEIRRRCRI